MKTYTTTRRADIYTRITDRIIADLENDVRPWLKPWNAGKTAGRITLRCGTTASPTGWVTVHG